MSTLIHVSENPEIKIFHPRPTPHCQHPVVWAVNDLRLCNYLLPRDCPRVTCYATSGLQNPELNAIIHDSQAMIAIEAGWFKCVRDCHLYLYHLPADTFEMLDEIAGYHVSQEAVKPIAVEPVSDIMAALLERDVEIRVVQNLWSLRDAILEATNTFSFIRMNNAQPRQVNDVQ